MSYLYINSTELRKKKKKIINKIKYYQVNISVSSKKKIDNRK